MDLKGIGVAMVTPFKENGEIDFGAIPGIVENIITGRADYLVVLGTRRNSRYRVRRSLYSKST